MTGISTRAKRDTTGPPDKQSGSENFYNQFRGRNLAILIMTIIYFPLVPLMILLFIPIYIFRFIASKSAPFLRPDLGKLLHTRSVVLAVDGFPSKPNWNVVVWLTQAGLLDLETFQEHFLNNYVQKKDKNGKLIYPEYQQHLAKWWGFYFWRWDTRFDIRNYIRPYDGKFSNVDCVDEDTLVQIVKELTWKPWDPERSPWEFLQIRNYCEKKSSTKKSILIYRIHHVIGDGNYLLKLLMGDLCEVNLETVQKPKYMERNIFQKLFFGIIFCIRAPYQLCKMYIEAYDVNPWHISHENMIRPMNAALTKPIKLDTIKKIKNIHGVNFSSVLNSAVAGGIRSMMIKDGIKNPADIHMGAPVPMPDHPRTLRNHFILSFITLPVGTEDPLQRLKRCDNILLDWKASSAALLNFIKLPLVGCLFPSMTHPFTFNRLSTCVMSNFPGTPDLPSFQGVKVTEMMFGAGFGPGSNGIGFTLCSCNGHIRLLTAVDPNILKTDEDVAELNAKIIEELEKLLAISCQMENET